MLEIGGRSVKREEVSEVLFTSGQECEIHSMEKAVYSLAKYNIEGEEFWGGRLWA